VVDHASENEKRIDLLYSANIIVAVFRLLKFRQAIASHKEALNDIYCLHLSGFRCLMAEVVSTGDQNRTGPAYCSRLGYETVPSPYSTLPVMNQPSQPPLDLRHRAGRCITPATGYKRNRVFRQAPCISGSTPSRSNLTCWSGGTYPWLNRSHVNRGLRRQRRPVRDSNRVEGLPFARSYCWQRADCPYGRGKTRGMSAVSGIEATINQHLACITPRVPVIAGKYLQLGRTAAYATLRSVSDDSGSTKGALTCE